MKNKLSFSAVEKYMQCPKQWYLYYLRGIREKFVGSALIFGGAFDKGLNILLDPPDDKLSEQGKPEDIQKYILEQAKLIFLKHMQTNRLNGNYVDLSSTPFVSYGNEDFDLDILTEEDIKDINEHAVPPHDIKQYHQELVELKKAKKLKGIALHRFNYMSWISLKRKGLLFLEAYKEQVLPNIKRIIAIQKEFSVKNDESDEFNGFIDLIAEYNDGRIVIFDNKTSASRYKDDSVETSKQLASYFGILDQLNLDIDVNNVYLGYIVIVKKIRKKKEPKVDIQILIEKPNEALVEEVFSNYDEVNQAIHDGKFPAKPETCKGFFGKCFCSLNKDQVVDISENWGKK